MSTDTTPPTVSSTSVSNGAIDVALNSSISATFSEAMDNATLNTASFTLAPTAGGAGVPGTVSVGGNTATFTPSANLSANKQYSATITTAAKDAAGNALAANFTWSFTTGSTLLLTPGLGAHDLAHYGVGSAQDPIATASMSTQTSGSTILACVGRGTFADFISSPVTDNKGNAPYIQQDTAHIYSLWTSSGTALYASPSAAGGSGHVVQTANPSTDEITLAVVEVINGAVVKEVKWNEVLSSSTHTSQSVTTTGPATLVAFWWGDDDGGSGDVTATPDQGFTVIDSQPISQQAVECVVATKNVSAAGSYNVTWTATPVQGAQLWLVAVQSA